MTPESAPAIAAETDDFEAALTDLVSRVLPGVKSLDKLVRLSGGASQETWAFDAIGSAAAPHRLILRRSPPSYTAPFRAAGIETEAILMKLAYEAGVPSPLVRHVLTPEDELGRGFLMDRVDGETIPRKILRDEAFAKIRPQLAFQLGGVLARIHAIDKAKLPKLRHVSAAGELAELKVAYKKDSQPRPVLDVAFRWLEERAPKDTDNTTLVHGDFRHGNLMIGPDGVRAVLDWELAHTGDPMEDLGWICTNSWRFGQIDKPVGGFGEVADLVAGYHQAGGKNADVDRIKYWETFGSLRWGVMCLGMLARFTSGEDRSVERAVIARRASENEIDLLRLLAPRR
ncbi:MAG: phosphotransferase family protein [Pseudomonadota bacterium]